MKLHFAYFDFENKFNTSNPFRGLGEIGLNFSATYDFFVTKDEKLQERSIYTLSCREKEPQKQLPHGFWGDRIYNVTALVGSNGVGKSSIIHSLINAVVMGLSPGVPFVLVLQNAVTSKGTDPGKFIIYYGGNIRLINECRHGVLSEVCPTSDYPGELKKAKIMLLDNTLSVSSIDLDTMYSRRMPIIKEKPANDGLEPKPVPEWGKQLYNKSLCASIRFSNEKSRAEQPRYLYSVEESLNAHFNYESYQETRFLFDPLQQAVFKKLAEQTLPVPQPRYVYVHVFDIRSMHRTALDKCAALDLERFTIPNACKCLAGKYYWHKILSASLYVLYCSAYEKMRRGIFSEALNRIKDIYSDDCERNNPFAFAEEIITRVATLMETILQDPVTYLSSVNGEQKPDRVLMENNFDSLQTEAENAKKILKFVKYIHEHQESLGSVFQGVTGQFQEDITPAANYYDFKIDIGKTNTNSENQQCVIGFLEHYKEASGFAYFMSFSTGLSSGQKNLLRMMTQFRYLLTNPTGSEIVTDSGEAIHNGMINWFSRGHMEESEKDSNAETKDDNMEKNAVVPCDTLLLFLDEADLTYHPEWQRKLVTLLTTLLPNMFQANYADSLDYGCKDIQIIIATHSPLLLSDIPLQSCIFLNGRKPEKEQSKDAEETDKKGVGAEKKSHNTVAVAADSMMEQTFGANIHGILSNAFFLDHTIGEYAYRKICDMFTNLKKLEESPDDPELVKVCKPYSEVIALIGDNILHNKLQSLYNRSFVPSKDVDSALLDIRKISEMGSKLTTQQRDEVVAALERAVDSLRPE